MVKTRKKVDDPLGPDIVKGLSLNLCTIAEKNFFHGVERMKRQSLLEAMVFFERAFKSDNKFHDAVFCSAAAMLCLGRVTEARSRFLQLLKDCPDFYGGYVIRFLRGFRLMVHLREGYNYRIRPEAADVAVLIGILYKREGKFAEAKKILQQALNADFGNKLVRVVLAEVLVAEGHPDTGLKLVEKMVGNLKDPLEGLGMNIRGRACLAIGDIRTGLLLLEGAARMPFRNEETFRDSLNIEAAREFEQREYLVDAFEALNETRDLSKLYTESETVGEAKQRLAARVNTLAKRGISKQLSLSRAKKKKQSRKEDYWEMGPRGR
jgi:tetratricopeptide (TPR) repeat protein